MAEDITKSVGLIVFTRLPETDELVAVLRRCGQYNFENGFREKTWAGACQGTAHGKLEQGESFHSALSRGIKEELGPYFFKVFDCCEGRYVLRLSCQDVDDKVTYGIFVHIEALRCIRLEPSSGGLVILRSYEVSSIHNLRNFNKKLGVADLTVVAMFPDEVESLKKGFERFEHALV